LPPATWEALSEITQKVTLRDATRNILLSTIAFGEYRNVLQAKSIILMLLIQSGSKMVAEDRDGYAVLVDTPIVEDNRKPLNAALQFFVEFSNANSPLYSWNRSKQDDKTAFLGEELALYFGFGSEEGDIRAKNPNLNFDMVTVPQGAGATIKRGYGKFYGLALVRGASNTEGTYQAILKLGSTEPTLAISEAQNMAPAHRVSINSGGKSASLETIFNQALIARGWLDPDSQKSSEIFQLMVEDVVSNRQKISAAATDAVKRLELAF
jgi:ABC-type glycerol-3-phosphate transport system substrate-binding protein